MTQEEITQTYNTTKWGQPLAVPATVFTIFSFICFAQGCGFAAGDATTSLSFGIVQVILFIGFFFGAALLIKRNVALPGQTMMIFAIAFGGVGGASNIMTYLQAEGMITYDPFVFGIVNFVIGLILVIELPAYCHGTLVDWATSFFPCLGLLIYGITGMGLCPVDMVAPLIFAAGVLFGLTGIGGLFVIASALLEGICDVPMGPALFPAKK
ncbi:MAG: hypothetical protein ACI37P_07250 [Eggerthellaceae bacterium]